MLSYEELLQWLEERTDNVKDITCKRGKLDLQGKNIVIYTQYISKNKNERDFKVKSYYWNYTQSTSETKIFFYLSQFEFHLSYFCFYTHV